MSDQAKPSMSFAEFRALNSKRCVCGAYHVGQPHLLYQHEYDRATPERQKEMLAEIADASMDKGDS